MKETAQAEEAVVVPVWRRPFGALILFVLANFALVLIAATLTGADRAVVSVGGPPVSAVLLWVALGLFNLALATLMLTARPRRSVHWLAAAWFGANGLAVPILQLGSLVDENHIIHWFYGQAHAIELITFVPILFIPFLFPRRILRLQTLFLLSVMAAILLLSKWWAAILVMDAVVIHVGVAASAVAYLGLFAGIIIFLDGYLTSHTLIRREQSRYLLSAYVVTAAAFVTYGNPIWGAPATVELSGLGFEVVFLMQDFLRVTVSLVAVGAVLIALAVARIRAYRHGSQTNPVSDDVFIVAIAGVGLLHPLIGVHNALVWMLVRPLLFTYGVLRFQLLDIDLRNRSGLLAVVVLTGLAVVYMTASDIATSAGMDTTTTASLALITTLALGLAFAWPIGRRLLVASALQAPMRDRDIYRAALEQVVSTPTATTGGSEMLQVLRARIGISEREHAAMELELRAANGTSIGVDAGRSFLGKYQVERLLGEGGHSRTWLAHDATLARPVVLKVTRWDSPRDAQRAVREGRILARLGHPNIVGIHDMEEVGPDLVLVLEYLPGGSLADRLATGPVAWEEARPLVDGILAGLEAAHEEGIIHRDLKPANVLLGADGAPKLADFGISRSIESTTASGFAFTEAGSGTLRYMSPEQARGEPATERSDLYAVGVVLYEMLQGRPYLELDGLSDFDARIAIMENGPAFPVPGVPRAVDRALRQTLSKDPERRPASAALLRKALKPARPSRATT